MRIYLYNKPQTHTINSSIAPLPQIHKSAPLRVLKIFTHRKKYILIFGFIKYVIYI